MPGPRRPRLAISACLGFEACRYDGERVDGTFVDRLRDRVEVVTVCPEVGLGMGIPRDPIRLTIHGGRTTLYQPSSGADFTEAMEVFCAGWLDELGAVDGFVLKGRSPSCAVGNAKLFASREPEALFERTHGLFAAHVAARFPDLPMVDEAGLEDGEVRERVQKEVFGG